MTAIDFAGSGGGKGVENHGGGIGAGFLLDDFDAGAAAPDFELFDRGGAEGVRSGRALRWRHLFSRRFESLPMVVVFPVPLTPTTNRTRGAAELPFPSAAGGGNVRIFSDLIFQLALQVFGFGELVLVDLLAEGGEDFFCGANTDVGTEQCRLELAQKLGVDGAIARKDLLDFRRELRLRFADGIFQALEERGFGWSEESNHGFAALGGNKYSSRDMRAYGRRRGRAEFVRGRV